MDTEGMADAMVLQAQLGQNLIDQCSYMNAADHNHAIWYHLKHKSGEKCRHFNYPDYFANPLCQYHPYGQTGLDNQSCTVLIISGVTTQREMRLLPQGRFNWWGMAQLVLQLLW